MRNRIDELLSAFSRGEGAVLLSVAERSGSAPRGMGASMLLLPDGEQKGTIGGGAVEYAAACEAAELMQTHGSKRIGFRLSASEIAQAGMICGGAVQVLLQYFEPSGENIALFSGLATACDAGAQAALVRRIEKDTVAKTGWWDGETMHGIAAALPENPGQPCLYGEGALLWEPVFLGARALVFGGGHVSQKLVPMLRYIGFRITVLEDRASFADSALFPEAENVVLGDFSHIDASVSLKTGDFAIVMTRGHQADYEILRQLLKTRARYIGCIGSRHKIALTREKLMKDGFTEKDCARVHMPIGLPIGAQTPEEIAVSIAAEMIFERAQNISFLS